MSNVKEKKLEKFPYFFLENRPPSNWNDPDDTLQTLLGKLHRDLYRRRSTVSVIEA